MTQDPGKARTAAPVRASRLSPAILISISAVLVGAVIAVVVVIGSSSTDPSTVSGKPPAGPGGAAVPATPAGAGLEPGRTLSGVAGPNSASAASFSAWRGKPVD